MEAIRVSSTSFAEILNENPAMRKHLRAATSSKTARTCWHEGCQNAAFNVDGKYLVGPRHVRVWACDEHFAGKPTRIVETPPEVIAALDAEEEHHAQMVNKYRYVAPEKGESVKTLASTGYGKKYGFDRAQSFRWGA